MLSINATALIVFAVVWVVVLVLRRFFFKPVVRILDERASRLEKDQAATALALESYESDLRRVEEGLKEAKAASAAAREQAEIEALKEKSRLLREVQAEGRAQVDKGRVELAREVERLKAEMDARTEEIARDIEKRILD